MNSIDGNPVVPCSHCAGEGWVVLTGIYAETLTLLRKQKQEISGAALARIAKVNPTAMNNRLVALESYGLATGRQYGSKRLWAAVIGFLRTQDNPKHSARGLKYPASSKARFTAD